LKKRFSKINIEISNICNLQCSFCPEVVRPKAQMEPALFREIIRQVAPLTEQVCLHLMGDPLTHPELETLINICTEYSTPVFLVTNGLLMRKQESQLLLREIFRQVNFSLHSFWDNFPGRDPSLYLQKIFEFTNVAMTERPDLYINFRLWNLKAEGEMSADNREIIRRVQDYFQVEINDRVNLRRHKSIHVKNRLYLHFDSKFIWPDLSLPSLGAKGTCYGLTSHFGILVDGTVVPCCLDKEGSISLGRVQDLPILEILESPRAKNILLGFQKKTLVEELCQRCQYIERFDRPVTLDKKIPFPRYFQHD